MRNEGQVKYQNLDRWNVVPTKSERDNITGVEERAFKELAKLVFGLSDEDLAKLVETGAYEKVEGDG